MSKVRLSASMCINIAEERDFVDQWKRCIPRRRQQWLREQVYLAMSSNFTAVSYKRESAEEDLTYTPATVRIQIDLDLRDSNDKMIHEVYESLSKARRGQWLRNALILGRQLGFAENIKVGKFSIASLPCSLSKENDERVTGQNRRATVGVALAEDIKKAAPETPIREPVEPAIRHGDSQHRDDEALSRAVLNEPDKAESDNDEPKIHASQLKGLFMAD